MEKELLLQLSDGEPRVKDIHLIENPQKMQMVFGKMSWKVLTALSKKAMYPLQLSRYLGVNEQLIYYYVRRLSKAGLIRVEREEKKKGAVVRFYRTVAPAFGVEFQNGYRPIPSQLSILSADSLIRQFVREFINERGCFEGKIVVGCPTPHGPFKTSARDGHYAAQLTFFLGQFIRNPSEFVIKLDTDVKAEKDETNNLLLVGGPGTNLITQEINEHLPIRFNMQSSDQGFLLGGMVSRRTSHIYTADTAGLVAKIVNPWDETKRIIVVAGNKAVGTKASVLALTNFRNKTLSKYLESEPFCTVVQGLDLDGDGKVDSIEVSE